MRLRTERQLEGWLDEHPAVRERILQEVREEYELEQAARKAKYASRKKRRKDVMIMEEVDNYD